jgi:hypothetical protein
MPTTRPRYAITATDEIEQALRDAARHWPEDRDNPRLLLLHLVTTGHCALRQHDDAEARQRAVHATAGAFSDAYSEDYLAELREDWPE